MAITVTVPMNMPMPMPMPSPVPLPVPIDMVPMTKMASERHSAEAETTEQQARQIYVHS